MKEAVCVFKFGHPTCDTHGVYLVQTPGAVYACPVSKQAFSVVARTDGIQEQAWIPSVRLAKQSLEGMGYRYLGDYDNQHKREKETSE